MAKMQETSLLNEKDKEAIVAAKNLVIRARGQKEFDVWERILLDGCNQFYDSHSDSELIVFLEALSLHHFHESKKGTLYTDILSTRKIMKNIHKHSVEEEFVIQYPGGQIAFAIE